MVLIAVLLAFAIPASAFAYTTFGYHLIGGVNGRQYNVVGNYATNIDAAVSSWNSAVNATQTSSVDVSFSKIYTPSGSEAIFLSSDRGANGHNHNKCFFVADASFR